MNNTKDLQSIGITNQYKRILIKISGEFFLSNNNEKFDNLKLKKLCNDIKNVLNIGINISLVIGGGNIIRGRDFNNNDLISRETADSIGMLSTVINGIIVRDILSKNNIDVEIVSLLDLPFDIKKLNPFTIRKLSEQDKLIIFVGGLGLPYFSTDTISVVGASLSQCDAILKATKTDGVYDKDPNIYPEAKYLEHITYDYALHNNLQIMDNMAFSLAKQFNMPIHVFSLFEDNCFIKALNKSIKTSVIN